MFLLAASLVLRADVAHSFIGESAKAILQVTEGTWTVEGKSFDSSYRSITVRRGDESLTTLVQEGRVTSQVLARPTGHLIIDHVQRQVRRFTAPAQSPDARLESAKPLLAPLEEGEFKWEIRTDVGLDLRSYPDFSDPKVEIADGIETLTAKVRKSDGKVGVLTLRRDSKTRIPTTLAFATPVGNLDLRFAFIPRKVESAELTLASSAYAGYEETRVPPSGTL